MTANQTKTKNRINQDDQYKDSIKPIVDEAMEAHNLAPAIKTAITENKPLNDEIQKIIAEAITRNPDVKKALDKCVSDNEIIKKSKATWKQPAWIITTVIASASAIAAIIAILK